MQWADRIGRRIKLRDLHLLHAVALADHGRGGLGVVDDRVRRDADLVARPAGSPTDTAP